MGKAGEAAVQRGTDQSEMEVQAGPAIMVPGKYVCSSEAGGGEEGTHHEQHFGEQHEVARSQ
jgi:hypothetical protein